MRRVQPSRRRLWLLIRIAVYLAVIAALLLFKGGVPFRRFAAVLKSSGDQTPTLVMAGRDVAPPLVERLAAEYRRDYPALTVTVLPGGTYRALDMLLARETDVAFLMRRPTAAEQDLFRAADGDTAVVQAIGVGGLVVLAGGQATVGPVTVEQLRAALKAALSEPGTGLAPYCGRLYAPDPNEGSWDALLEALGLPLAAAPDSVTAGVAPAQQVGGSITFLADPAAVIAAVAADPTSWGVVSTLDAALDDPDGAPAGTRYVGVIAESGSEAVSPSAATIATGAYPLHHFLYVASRGSGGVEGGKFLNHLASARGLRQVESSGVIPARLVARSIQLTRDRVGTVSP